MSKIEISLISINERHNKGHSFVIRYFMFIVSIQPLSMYNPQSQYWMSVWDFQK